MDWISCFFWNPVILNRFGVFAIEEIANVIKGEKVAFSVLILGILWTTDLGVPPQFLQETKRFASVKDSSRVSALCDLQETFIEKKFREISKKIFLNFLWKVFCWERCFFLQKFASVCEARLRLCVEICNLYKNYGLGKMRLRRNRKYLMITHFTPIFWTEINIVVCIVRTWIFERA